MFNFYGITYKQISLWSIAVKNAPRSKELVVVPTAHDKITKIDKSTMRIFVCAIEMNPQETFRDCNSTQTMWNKFQLK